MEKLYIVVRSDISPGLQAAQACHALRQFAHRHPDLDREWFQGSNNIVILQAPSLDRLALLEEKASEGGVAHVPREPLGEPLDPYHRPGPIASSR